MLYCNVPDPFPWCGIGSGYITHWSDECPSAGAHYLQTVCIRTDQQGEDEGTQVDDDTEPSNHYEGEHPSHPPVVPARVLRREEGGFTPRLQRYKRSSRSHCRITPQLGAISNLCPYRLPSAAFPLAAPSPSIAFSNSPMTFYSKLKGVH